MSAAPGLIQTPHDERCAQVNLLNSKEQCTLKKGHAGQHEDRDFILTRCWHRRASDNCAPEAALEVQQPCPECGGQSAMEGVAVHIAGCSHNIKLPEGVIVAGPGPQMQEPKPLCGEWVLVIHELPRRDIPYVETQSNDGVFKIVSREELLFFPAHFHAWLRLYPRPEPPPIPKKPCCADWRAQSPLLHNAGKAISYCPWCGVERPRKEVEE